MTKYSIIQFLPDPTTEERINIGVVVFGDDGPRSRFLRRWHRVRHFAPNTDIGFLQEVARDVGELSADQIPLELALTNPESLDSTMGRWMNGVQLTPLRASTKPPEELLDYLARRFLREDAQRRARGRDRRAAVAVAREHISDALEAASMGAMELLKKSMQVQGALEVHEFDLGLKNGKPYLGVLGLSFERQSTAETLKDLHAAAWAIDDVRHTQPKLELAVVMLPPKTRSKTYDRAVHVIEGLEAAAVPELEVPDWAVDAVRSVPAKLLRPRPEES